MDARPFIVVATDLSARSDRAIDRALMLAGELGTAVRAVHVIRRSRANADREAAFKAVREVLPDPNADIEIVLPCGSAPVEIARAGAGAVLIVTGVARFNSIGDFLLGTAVDHVIRDATVPVLVVKRRPHRAYRKLLVATDFSDCAREALLAAARLFPETAIRLFHAYAMPPGTGPDEYAVQARLLGEAREEADVFLADPAIPDDVRGRVEIELSHGLVELIVNEAVARFDADLVVLGTQGKGAVERTLIGSTAEHLLTQVAVDTLVVPQSAD